MVAIRCCCSSSGWSADATLLLPLVWLLPLPSLPLPLRREVLVVTVARRDFGSSALLPE
jgi:hypothetical protein